LKHSRNKPHLTLPRSSAIFSDYLTHYESVLKAFVTKLQLPDPHLKTAIEYVVLSGGKRLRPLLTYLCGEALQIPRNVLDPLACAIELIHCYSLVHDDLPAMDNDDFRRGRPSCHRAFNEATAILVGDGLQTLAIECLATELPPHLESARVVNIIRILTHAAGPFGMISGQSLDLSMLSEKNVSEAMLKHIHQLKTGDLFSAIIDMVLATTDEPESVMLALRTFAKHLGLAFQMQDDYLAHVAPPEALGKTKHSDQQNGKFTFANYYIPAVLHDKINHVWDQALLPIQDKSHRYQGLVALVCFIRERVKC